MFDELQLGDFENALSDDDAMDIAERDHPEWRKLLTREALPDEIMDENGEPMNPRMHLMLHAIAERQLAADRPKGVVALVEQMKRRGVSHHETRHVIARAVVNQLFDMMQGRGVFDEERYMKDLQREVRRAR